jgi:hypothetical protein
VILSDRTVLRDLGRASRLEWLEANGLGGYACGTVSGAHTRRYHGLLVAATRPPLGRVLLLAKLEETVVRADGRCELGANFFPGAVHPRGHEFLAAFERALFPSFTYEAHGARIRKIVAAIHDENTTVIAYEVLDAPGPFSFELRPFVAFRGHHGLARAASAFSADVRFDEGTLSIARGEGFPALFLWAPGASFEHAPDWYYQFDYPRERERGFDHREDLFTPGLLRIPLGRGARFGVVASTGNPAGRDAFALLGREASRRKLLLEQSGLAHPLGQALVLSADAFLVRRGEAGRTVLAGYPWLCDRGREAMASVPGLCLATRRFGDARKVLRTWAGEEVSGLLPRSFLEDGSRTQEFSLAASLWMFVAANRYVRATGDFSFVREELLPALRRIAFAVEREAAEGGLLRGGGEPDGSSLEGNALWPSALAILSVFERWDGRMAEARRLARLANLARGRFLDAFWSEREGCLVEGAAPAGFQQLLVVGLPFAPLDGEKQRRVLEAVEKMAGGPGAPSLARSGFRGAYASAVARLRRAAGRRAARSFLERLQADLAQGMVGSLGFDEESGGSSFGPPAPAQAMAVAEALRAWAEQEGTEAAPGPPRSDRKPYRIVTRAESRTGGRGGS